jgi:hypothetical protein
MSVGGARYYIRAAAEDKSRHHRDEHGRAHIPTIRS